VEADLTGGTNYVEMGVSPLLSVPFALYAKYASNAVLPDGAQAGNTPYWNGSQWIIDNSNIHNNGGRVGIGTSTPFQKLDVNGQVNIPLDSAYMINNKSILNARGSNNLFIGLNAGAMNTIGFHNLYAGFNSGVVNTIGSQNTFLGSETGVSNTEGLMNSFLGRRAGFSNTLGNENTFIGCYAGQSNTSGQHNSFFGVTTGNNNTTGEENTFLGAHAGYFNNTGNNNTYIGNFAGQFMTTGNNNVIIGFGADGQTSGLSNAIAIGAGSVVSSSNTVVIGNTAITSIGGQVGWSTLSDKRLKTNVVAEPLGLDFILALQPVRYNYTLEGQENRVYSGFLAQDVEATLQQLGIPFSGIVIPENEKGNYSIRYAEFVVPMTNAIQEQQTQIEELKRINTELQQKIDRLTELEERIKALEKK
jgi:trimeric autotransporter adhesin